jgi:hypothetical protein
MRGCNRPQLAGRVAAGGSTAGPPHGDLEAISRVRHPAELPQPGGSRRLPNRRPMTHLRRLAAAALWRGSPIRLAHHAAPELSACRRPGPLNQLILSRGFVGDVGLLAGGNRAPAVEITSRLSMQSCRRAMHSPPGRSSLPTPCDSAVFLSKSPSARGDAELAVLLTAHLGE